MPTNEISLSLSLFVLQPILFIPSLGSLSLPILFWIGFHPFISLDLPYTIHKRFSSELHGHLQRRGPKKKGFFSPPLRGPL